MWQLQLLLALFVTTCLFSIGLASGNCGPGLDTPGVTIPRGDIILEHGNPLEIFCVLDPSHPKVSLTGKTSKNLVFYHNDKPVTQEFVTVVNSTTIRLYVEKPPAMKSMYYCKLQSNEANQSTRDDEEEEYEAVCLNSVAIAYKPQEVLNFTCISQNWENLTCSWTKPVNYIKTTYSLRYRLPGRAGGRILYGCPNSLDLNESRCFWDVSTDPHYRQPYEYYYFTMTGDNILGNVTFPVIKFHHYTHVIPQSPVGLRVLNHTSYSVCLFWSVPFPMQIFPPGLIQKVQYQSELDGRGSWKDVNTSILSSKNQNHTLNVTGLQYANTLYEIKIYMKSAAVAFGSDMWSVPANLTVKTSPTVPGAPPMTDIGSFEVTGGSPARDIYLYWRHIPEHLKNGDQFEYKVYKVDEYGEHLLQAVESSKAFAKFKGFNYASHNFKVISSNKEGRSVNVSGIHVPGRSESPPEPISFTKIAFAQGLYELSWKPPPERNLAVDNYTIFWCDNDRDRPYPCTGYLNWIHVPKNETVLNKTLPEDKIYQFAISANTKKGSSGMVWASCTVIHDRVVGKMKNVWINRIGSRFIEVGWKLDCSDRVGIVIGYRISYCPIYGLQDIRCKEEERNATKNGDPTTIHGIVEDLKPYTTYMVAVAVITKNGGGLLSDPLFNTTLEAAPDSSPNNVVISNVTNSSMQVSWDPPLQTNGLLRQYEVYFNEKNLTVGREKNQTYLDLTNLTSYLTYNISVAACTVACSIRSPVVSVRTGIGMPGEMERPTVRFINSSQVLVIWRPPTLPAGALDFYQLRVVQKNGNTNVSDFLYNVTGVESQIPIPDCKGEGSSLTYAFAVRGVNLGLNASYPGVWSHPGETNCFNSVPVRNVLIVIWVFGILAATACCLALGYTGKRVWQRCKVMQDVEVKLPPGLAPLGDKEILSQVQGWPMSDGDQRKDSASADEEHLLTEKEDRDGHGRNPSGDSSGCSSGHESVSSSVLSTSGTHMSSDSGTERAHSPDGVFSEPSTWECSSLRQRTNTGVEDDPYVRMGKISSGSVARSTPNLTDLDGLAPGDVQLGTWSSTGYISMPSSEDMMGTDGGVGVVHPMEGGSGYCRVGLNPTAAVRQPVKGYVSIASMIESSSGDGSPITSRPSTSGYVSHRPKEVSKAYVTIPSTSLYENESPPYRVNDNDSYCRMGFVHPLSAPVKSNPGYVPLTEGFRSTDISRGGNYVPHERLDKSVFVPVSVSSDSVKSPTSV